MRHDLPYFRLQRDTTANPTKRYSSTLLALCSCSPPPYSLRIFFHAGPGTFDQSLFRDNVVHALVMLINRDVRDDLVVIGETNRSAPASKSLNARS